MRLFNPQGPQVVRTSDRVIPEVAARGQDRAKNLVGRGLVGSKQQVVER